MSRKGFYLKKSDNDWFKIDSGVRRVAGFCREPFLKHFPAFKDLKIGESCPIDIIIKKRKLK